MKKYIAPPFLSTSFSESGKRAKKRFANILDVKTKRLGAAVIAFALALTAGAGAAVSVETYEGAEETLYERAGILMTGSWDEKIKSVWHENLDDNGYNYMMDYILEIERYLGPYTAENRNGGRIYRFENPFELMGEKRSNDIMNACAIWIIALVGDAEFVEWTYPVPGGEETRRLTAEEADRRTGRNLKNLHNEEMGLHYLDKTVRLHYYKGDFGYGTESEFRYFRSMAFDLTSDGPRNAELLDIFLRAVQNGLPSELRYVREVDGVKVMGAVITDGESFTVNEFPMDYDAPTVYYIFDERYSWLQVRKNGEAAEFYLRDPEKADFRLFTVEKGEKYEEAVY